MTNKEIAARVIAGIDILIERGNYGPQMQSARNNMSKFWKECFELEAELERLSQEGVL